MDALPPSPLRLPSFLFGPQSAVNREVKAEGRRCARQYALDGSFPQPRELLAVARGAAVLTNEVSDLQPASPAWRLYAVSELLMGIDDALRDQIDYRILREAHESVFRATAWGALFYMIEGPPPHGAKRTGLRLGAVLRSWDSLQHDHYQYTRLDECLSLEQLLVASCGWALDAWCPEGGDSIRSCFEVAAERLLRATRKDCVEAILRQLPTMRLQEKDFKHPDVVTDPAFCRERLTSLDEASFESLSAACPAWVLQRLYIWDKQLDRQ